MARKSDTVYQFKVSLDEIKPAIWRRFQVLADTPLVMLHDVLQIVMGWWDAHLHEFTIRGIRYGIPDDEYFDDYDLEDEQDVRLNELGLRLEQKIAYLYDFGDGWRHTLVLEKVLPAGRGGRWPYCVEGQRACPPEDCGGPYRYPLLLQTLKDPQDEEHEEMLVWVGERFDPEAFDLELVNQRLARMGRGRTTEQNNPWWVDDLPKAYREAHGEETADWELFEPQPAWAGTLDADGQVSCQELPIRRDLLVLLDYLRDNRATGTTSTGNLPLKAVRAVCSDFVNPPPLEDRIGEKVYPVRSENEIPPLMIRHALAVRAGLVEGGPGKRWRLTARGEEFLAAQPAVQTWHLVKSWWAASDWRVGLYTDHFVNLEITPSLARHTLKDLLARPAGKLQDPKEASAGLVVAERLVMNTSDREWGQRFLAEMVEDMALVPLVDFGILAAEFDEPEWPFARYRPMTSFQVTPFGRSLLEALQPVLRRAYPWVRVED